MKRLCLGACAALTFVSSADARLKIGSPSALASDRILSRAVQPLLVASPAVEAGRPIPLVYTPFGKDLSPAVSWDGAPATARSFVIVMEDPDSHGSRPALHWLVYDVPQGTTSVPRSLREADRRSGGPFFGKNYAGGEGYIGPSPAPGDPPHHYHIEVFALSRVLKLKPGADLDAVLQAMNESVLAEGETVGTFAAPAGRPDE